MTLFKIKFLLLLFALTFSVPYGLIGQILKDSRAGLIRFNEDNTASFKIPLTKFCFVQEAGLNKDGTSGWIMKWDVEKKANSNLLLMEMNSTDIKGWWANNNLSGSVQLVFELPAFSDSIVLKQLSYRTKGLYIVNNYGGLEKQKENLSGEIKIVKNLDNIFISSSIDLNTVKPKTRQQFVLTNHLVQQFTFKQFQEYMDKSDAESEVEKEEIVNALTEAIISRDSIWEAANLRIKDSLNRYPYMGSFRFWVSDIDKSLYSRITYYINEDSLIIKEGPYNFIYLAKNYPGDSMYYKRALTQNEKKLLFNIEHGVGLDTLKSLYSNLCIMDGLVLSFSFESTKFLKDVTVSNYYNENIAKVVLFINKIVPKKYRIRYDKKELVKQQSECGR